MSNDAAWALMVNQLTVPSEEAVTALKNTNDQTVTDMTCALTEMTLLKGQTITYHNFHQSNTKKNV